jgi:hypothetical protein
MEHKAKGHSTGSTGSRTGGSKAADSPGQMKNRSDLPGTSTGKWTGAPPEAVTHQPGEKKSEKAGMKQTEAMLGKEKGKSGPLPRTTTTKSTGAPPEAVTHQPGQKKSEEAGMKQTSAMLSKEKGKKK